MPRSTDPQFAHELFYFGIYEEGRVTSESFLAGMQREL
jgi:hypothetical protein